MGNDGRFQLDSTVAGSFQQPKELQYIRLFEQVLRLGDMLPLRATARSDSLSRSEQGARRAQR